jgi:single-strand DNA-binding protein
MLNRVVLIGRLTKDVEVRFTSSGTAVANFTVACNRKFNDETDFIQVVVWRGLAENCHKYIGKGSLVALEGRLQVSNYEDQDGKKVWKTEVVAEDVRFLDSKKEQQEDQGDSFQVVGKPIDLDDLDLPFDI